MGRKPDNFGVSTQWSHHNMARWSRAQYHQDRYRHNDFLWVSEVPFELRNTYYEYLESAALPVMLGREIPEPSDGLEKIFKRHYNSYRQQDIKAWINRQAAFIEVKERAHREFRESYQGEEYRVLRKAG